MSTRNTGQVVRIRGESWLFGGAVLRTLVHRCGVLFLFFYVTATFRNQGLPSNFLRPRSDFSSTPAALQRDTARTRVPGVRGEPGAASRGRQGPAERTAARPPKGGPPRPK